MSAVSREPREGPAVVGLYIAAGWVVVQFSSHTARIGRETAIATAANVTRLRAYDREQLDRLLRITSCIASILGPVKPVNLL